MTDHAWTETHRRDTPRGIIVHEQCGACDLILIRRELEASERALVPSCESLRTLVR